jgi:hypothetical protein
MKRVAKIILPDNRRLDFHADASEDILGKFVPLPIEIPRALRVWTGRDGRPLVMWCDHQRIRPCDFATVLRGIEQYNRDLLGEDDAP